jgi:hypothetical protein
MEKGKVFMHKVTGIMLFKIKTTLNEGLIKRGELGYSRVLGSRKRSSIKCEKLGLRLIVKFFQF